MAKRVILNIQQMRAKKTADVAVVVDMYGVEHPIVGASLDTYLETLRIEELFDQLRDLEGGTDVSAARRLQIELLERLTSLVQTTIPKFPVGGLQLEELYAISQAIQGSAAPDGGAEETEAASNEPGE